MSRKVMLDEFDDAQMALIVGHASKIGSNFCGAHAKVVDAGLAALGYVTVQEQPVAAVSQPAVDPAAVDPAAVDPAAVDPALGAL